MKATVSPISQRITLNLDVAITFEALILNKLMGIPRAGKKSGCAVCWYRALRTSVAQLEMCKSPERPTAICRERKTLHQLTRFRPRVSKIHRRDQRRAHEPH